MKKKLVVLSGAGMSAESGIKTFRDADGLWEGHNIADVATPEAWRRNPELVLDFYNQRRKQLLQVIPNLGHEILAELEVDFDVSIVTQNVDDLHERAGSSQVLHLHGELFKVRSVANPRYILDWKTDLKMDDFDDKGNQLRPHIVWFGEAVPALEKAIPIVESADFLVIIGTSLQVYPAASLMDYTQFDTPIYYIDPNPATDKSFSKNIKIIPEKASTGLKKLEKELKNLK